MKEKTDFKRSDKLTTRYKICGKEQMTLKGTFQFSLNRNGNKNFQIKKKLLTYVALFYWRGKVVKRQNMKLIVNRQVLEIYMIYALLYQGILI